MTKQELALECLRFLAGEEGLNLHGLCGDPDVDDVLPGVNSLDSPNPPSIGIQSSCKSRPSY